MPTSLATLAALVALLAATAALPETAVFERSRGWVSRPIDGDEAGSGSSRALSICLAHAARELLGAKVHVVATISPLHSLHLAPDRGLLRASSEVASRAPQRHLLLVHLDLPPPLA